MRVDFQWIYSNFILIVYNLGDFPWLCQRFPEGNIPSGNDYKFAIEHGSLLVDLSIMTISF